MTHKKLTTLLLTAALSACVTGPVYHPASKPGAEGFTEQKIQENRFRVTFNGNVTTARETVEDYLLYRAAELTTENGYSHFTISEKETDARKTTRTTRRPAYYGRYTHFDGDFYRSFPFYASGFRWSYPYQEDITEYNLYSATAYIDMYHVDAANTNRKAFNAKSVIENLAPLICLDEVGNCSPDHSHD